MAFKSTAKAQALVRDLKEKLDLRIANAASPRVNQSRQINDANGWPIIIMSRGNEAAGQPVIAIRIKGIDAVSKDIFGNDITAAAPHNAEIAYETDAADDEAQILDLIKVMFELAKLGTKIQVKVIANGTAVTEASMDAAAASESIDNLYWPTKSV